MTKWVGLWVCLGALLIVCNVAVAEGEEARPLQTLVEAVKDGARGIGGETRAAAEDVLVLVRDEAAYVGTSVKEAPARVGPAAKDFVPDLLETVEGFVRSPDDEVESLVDWLLEPLDVLAGDDLF